MERNGLLAAIEESGGEPHFFDERPFEDGYVDATFDFDTVWTQTPHIAKVITEVDHIVYLGRLSSHTLTGYTHGLKIAVGWMRDDTRHDMHYDAANIFEKYTDLSYCIEIRSRLRLVVSYAEEVLLHGGPDGGGIALADPRIVLASSHLANHDIASVMMLKWAMANLPETRSTSGFAYGAWSFLTNGGLLAGAPSNTGLDWTSQNDGFSTYLPHAYRDGIASDRSLSRAYLVDGGIPASIALDLVGSAPDESLLASINDQERMILT